MDVIRYLYVFVVLLVLGHFTLDFLLAIGVTSAAYLKPILGRFIVFYFFLGILDLAVKLIGERGEQALKKKISTHWKWCLSSFPN